MAVLGEVPCVVVDVQRVGPGTGLATKPAQADFMQARWGRHGDQTLIALCPASVSECFRLTVEAFNLSERFRVPVVLLPDEIVGHMRESIEVPEPGNIPVLEREEPAGGSECYLPFSFSTDAVVPLASYGCQNVFHVSSSMHGLDGYSNNDPENAAARIRHLHEKIERHKKEIVRFRTFETDDMEVLIIGAGAPVRAARAAARNARKSGIRAGVLQLQTIWPFPSEIVAELADKVSNLVVVEMNYAGQLAGEVEKAVGRNRPITRVRRYNGTVIRPAEIEEALS